MSSETEHRYLVLANIDGYTSHVAKVELGHINRMEGSETDKCVNRYLPAFICEVKLIDWRSGRICEEQKQNLQVLIS